jgi:hypothetical protein
LAHLIQIELGWFDPADPAWKEIRCGCSRHAPHFFINKNLINNKTSRKSKGFTLLYFVEFYHAILPLTSYRREPFKWVLASVFEFSILLLDLWCYAEFNSRNDYLNHACIFIQQSHPSINHEKRESERLMIWDFDTSCSDFETQWPARFFAS